jgi:phosphoribosylanthranilate isomerase
MPIKVKICGITQFEDAKVAVSVGVDALGFIFYPKSPRYIHPQKANEIIKRLPPFIAKVGVFVNSNASSIMTAVEQSGIDTVQLHGSEPPELCQKLSMTLIKAFSIGKDFDPAVLDQYQVNGFLLDTWSESLAGGTGRTFDWTIAKTIARYHHNIILAGGLGPTNIVEALETVQPYGVEFNSGVEIKPGIKNPRKMRDAVEIVKSWK